MDGDERRFSDAEVSNVLQRLHELEISEALPSAPGALTRLDLEAVVEEAGYPPGALDEALRGMAPRSGGERLAERGRSIHSATRWVPGRLNEGGLRRLRERIEDLTDSNGRFTPIEGGFEWGSERPERRLTVSLVVDGDRMRVRVTERLSDGQRRRLLIAPSLTAAALTAGTIGMLEPTSLFVAAGVAVSAAVGAFIGRAAFDRRSRRAADTVERIAVAIAEQLTEGEGPFGGSLGGTSCGPGEAKGGAGSDPGAPDASRP